MHNPPFITPKGVLAQNVTRNKLKPFKKILQVQLLSPSIIIAAS